MASRKGLFGTNGIRGLVNLDLNNEFITKVTKAIATFIGPEKSLIIGQDTRISGDMVKMNVISVLLSSGINVYDAGIVPTPALQFASKNLGYFGIMITASHNPPEYNGIKCIDYDGTELDELKENIIEDIYFENKIKNLDWKSIGSYNRIENINRNYIEGVLNLIDRNSIKNSNLKVLVDCSNGPSYLTSPFLLKKLNVRYTTINCNPDGYFSGHNPEPKEENLQELMKFTKGNYDLGVAHDGDADRVVFVDENGNFIPGDKILALITKHILKNNKGYIVLPVSASQAVEEVAIKEEGKVVYTRVGAPIIARKMIELNAVFGGEDNGGLIFPEMQYCRDGAMGMAKILEIISKHKKSISDLISELPEYYVKKGSVSVNREDMISIMDTIKSSVKGDRVLDIDGIKVYDGDSWVLIRPSGTEPIIRIYSESKDRKSSENLFRKYKEVVESISKEKQLQTKNK